MQFASASARHSSHFHEQLHSSSLRLSTSTIIMRFSTVALYVLGAVSTAFAASTSGTATVTYSTAYDDGDTSLNSVACSNGDNGLITKGTFILSGSFHCQKSHAIFLQDIPPLVPFPSSLTSVALTASFGTPPFAALAGS